ncbi:hypothetical protein [Undibacterium fentianense]|uniref:Uncharacterized protein n=1 Tax=Undibacterium fentianense TaxID=2828728 RepID=A0A941IEM9_9BURK|nr:hypothetical protein [Undibacterium fentianense]MBR7799801.1 hypothetical protein [Undibacterium fentianense]
MKTLFLHFGTTKTGSSSIQEFLAGHQAQLAKDGYFYPIHGAYYRPAEASQSLLAHGVLGRQPAYLNGAVIDRDRVIAEIRRDLFATTARKLIVSSEHFAFGKSVEDYEAIKEVFTPITSDIRVIIYLRRQDLRMESSWAQVIKGGARGSVSFNDYLRENPAWDYRELLGKIAHVFGRSQLIVRPFERTQLYRKNVVNDFLRLIGIELDAELKSEANVTPPFEIVELIRLFNQHLSSLADRNAFIGFLQSKKIPIDQTKYTMFTHESRMTFLAGVRDSNAEVAREYLQRDDGKLFLDPDESVYPVYPGLSVDRLADFSAYMFAALNADNQKMQQVLQKIAQKTGLPISV